MGAAKSKTLDFSGVEERSGGFRPRRKPEGDYYAHVTDVRDHTSKEGNEGWVFTIKVDGEARATYPYYINFDKEQLWKARGLATACGVKVPSGKVKMDPNKLVGKALGVALVDDEYEGRMKSVIDAVFPLEELTDARNEPTSKASSTKAKSRQAEEDDEDEDDEDEDEAPKRGKKGKTSASKKRQVDDDEDDEDEDEEDDEPPAKKSKGKKSKKSRDDDEDEDEDDEDEPPAKSKTKGKKSKAKKSRDDDDDDDELDIDDL